MTGNRIPKAELDYYEREFQALEEDASTKVMRVLGRMDWKNADIAKCREAVVQAVQMALSSHTRLSAQAAADMYGAIRESQIGNDGFSAVAKPGYDEATSDRAIRYYTGRIVDAEHGEADMEEAVSQFNALVLDHVSDQISRAASNSMFENGTADPKKPRFARVPEPGACDFCIMLGSRGFVYLTRKTAGEFEKFHENCRCRVLPGWSGGDEPPRIEGYDPDELYRQYRENEEAKRKGGR